MEIHTSLLPTYVPHSCYQDHIKPRRWVLLLVVDFWKKNVSLLRGKMIDVSLLSIENRSLSTWENHKFHFNNERLPILLTISKCFYQDFTVNLYTCFLRLNLSSVFLLLKKQYIYIERWGRSGYLFLECIHIYNGLSPHFRHMSVKQISS